MLSKERLQAVYQDTKQAPDLDVQAMNIAQNHDFLESAFQITETAFKVTAMTGDVDTGKASLICSITHIHDSHMKMKDEEIAKLNRTIEMLIDSEGKEN